MANNQAPGGFLDRIRNPDAYKTEPPQKVPPNPMVDTHQQYQQQQQQQQAQGYRPSLPNPMLRQQSPTNPLQKGNSKDAQTPARPSAVTYVVYTPQESLDDKVKRLQQIMYKPSNTAAAAGTGAGAPQYVSPGGVSGGGAANSAAQRESVSPKLTKKVLNAFQQATAGSASGGAGKSAPEHEIRRRTLSERQASAAKRMSPNLYQEKISDCKRVSDSQGTNYEQYRTLTVRLALLAVAIAVCLGVLLAVYQIFLKKPSVRFCDTGSLCPIEKNLVPCPKDGTCANGRLTCNTGFIRVGTECHLKSQLKNEAHSIVRTIVAEMERANGHLKCQALDLAVHGARPVRQAMSLADFDREIDARLQKDEPSVVAIKRSVKDLIVKEGAKYGVSPCTKSGENAQNFESLNPAVERYYCADRVTYTLVCRAQIFWESYKTECGAVAGIVAVLTFITLRVVKMRRQRSAARQLYAKMREETEALGEIPIGKYTENLVRRYGVASSRQIMAYVDKLRVEESAINEIFEGQMKWLWMGDGN